MPRGRPPKPKPPPILLDEDSDDDNDSSKFWCTCRAPVTGFMIDCSNGRGCMYRWFHGACVGLDRKPHGNRKWYCADCTEARNPPKRKYTKRIKKESSDEIISDDVGDVSRTTSRVKRGRISQGPSPRIKSEPAEYIRGSAQFSKAGRSRSRQQPRKMKTATVARRRIGASSTAAILVGKDGIATPALARPVRIKPEHDTTDDAQTVWDVPSDIEGTRAAPTVRSKQSRKIKKMSDVEVNSRNIWEVPSDIDEAEAASSKPTKKPSVRNIKIKDNIDANRPRSKWVTLHLPTSESSASTIGRKEKRVKLKVRARNAPSTIPHEDDEGEDSDNIDQGPLQVEGSEKARKSMIAVPKSAQARGVALPPVSHVYSRVREPISQPPAPIEQGAQASKSKAIRKRPRRDYATGPRRLNPDRRVKIKVEIPDDDKDIQIIQEIIEAPTVHPRQRRPPKPRDSDINITGQNHTLTHDGVMNTQETADDDAGVHTLRSPAWTTVSRKRNPIATGHSGDTQGFSTPVIDETMVSGMREKSVTASSKTSLPKAVERFDASRPRSSLQAFRKRKRSVRVKQEPSESEVSSQVMKPRPLSSRSQGRSGLHARNTPAAATTHAEQTFQRGQPIIKQSSNQNVGSRPSTTTLENMSALLDEHALYNMPVFASSNASGIKTSHDIVRGNPDRNSTSDKDPRALVQNIDDDETDTDPEYEVNLATRRSSHGNDLVDEVVECDLTTKLPKLATFRSPSKSASKKGMKARAPKSMSEWASRLPSKSRQRESRRAVATYEARKGELAEVRAGKAREMQSGPLSETLEGLSSTINSDTPTEMVKIDLDPAPQAEPGRKLKRKPSQILAPTTLKQRIQSSDLSRAPAPREVGLKRAGKTLLPMKLKATKPIWETKYANPELTHIAYEHVLRPKGWHAREEKNDVLVQTLYDAVMSAVEDDHDSGGDSMAEVMENL